MAEFIAKKREMFLVQMSLNTKREEIRKLEEKVRVKEEALRKSEQVTLPPILGYRPPASARAPRDSLGRSVARAARIRLGVRVGARHAQARGDDKGPVGAAPLEPEPASVRRERARLRDLPCLNDTADARGRRHAVRHLPQGER